MEKVRKINWEAVIETSGPNPIRRSGRTLYRMNIHGLLIHGKREVEFEIEATGKRQKQTTERALNQTVEQSVTFLQSGPIGTLAEGEIENVRNRLRSYFQTPSSSDTPNIIP